MENLKTSLEPIESKKAISLLIETIPALGKYWNGYLKELQSNSKEPDNSFSDISEISFFITEKFQNKETDGFDKFWSAVEFLIFNGDSHTSDLMIIGLIEGLQNRCSWKNLNYYTGFDEWLNPTTKKAWDDLIEYWEKKSK